LLPIYLIAPRRIYLNIFHEKQELLPNKGSLSTNDNKIKLSLPFTVYFLNIFRRFTCIDYITIFENENNENKTPFGHYTCHTVTITSCNKEENEKASAPTVSTTTVSDIGTTTAVCGGSITSKGNADITERGVCWSTESYPTIANSKTSDGTGKDFFTISITGLSAGSTYHARAYATNSIGTSYGDDISFTTSTTLPSVATLAISAISKTGASSGGIITTDGGAEITAYGVCWGSSANPTIANSKTNDGTGVGSFTSTITGLTANTVYHVRAYAINSAGTAYGDDITFTSSPTVPTITTNAISSITMISALSGGTITSNGGAEVTAYGVCWGTSTNPTTSDSKTTDGTGSNTFTSSITGLTLMTTYHVRAYAINAEGTAYGNDVVFTTLAELPTVPDNDNMLLGNPSNATTDIVNANNYLMVKPQYCMSYNNSKRTTNWTSWHLYSGDLGSTDRSNDFREDATLPSGWYQVGSSDFKYSTYGFDRGHMCPSADRTFSSENNSATFLMTNMIPQAPNNNQQTWSNLEGYCRTLVNANNELFIICGPYGQGGTSAKGTFSILSTGVVVPSQTWKIIVVLANGNNDLSRISASTRVIAVWMPNSQTISSTWTNYRVSVDYIESQTGYDFLSNVPTSIQEVIEARVDNL